DLALRMLLATANDIQDYQQAIRTCKAMGMDSMSIDISDPNAMYNIQEACAAAAIEGSFTIAPCLDFYTGKSAATVSGIVAPYLGYTQLATDSGGNILLWTFGGVAEELL